jgi:hypothetical protein
MEFMVELYAPASTEGSSARAAEDAARSLRDEGLAVRYLRSIVIPGDETCFHVFEAPSAEAVREVSRRAAIRFERIVPVIEVEPSASTHPLARGEE